MSETVVFTVTTTIKEILDVTAIIELRSRNSFASLAVDLVEEV
jgi:hypothetical protein